MIIIVVVDVTALVGCQQHNYSCCCYISKTSKFFSSLLFSQLHQCHHGAMCGVTVSTSTFLACHQCYCVGLSLAWA